MCISFRGKAQWSDNHILHKVLPWYFQYPPVTKHSYYSYWLYSLYCTVHPHDYFVTTNLHFLIPSPFSPSPSTPLEWSLEWATYWLASVLGVVTDWQSFGSLGYHWFATFQKHSYWNEAVADWLIFRACVPVCYHQLMVVICSSLETLAKEQSFLIHEKNMYFNFNCPFW